MIQVQSDQTPAFLPQRSILKQMEETMMVLSKPKLIHAPIIAHEDFSQQSLLLKEIDFFCQKLTTVKKSKPKLEDVSTKQFTCSTPDIQKLQKLVEPDEQEQQEQPIVRFAEQPTIASQPTKTLPKPKLVIKKLQFELEQSYTWIPIRIEKKLEKELLINLNLCIFWPEEELINLRMQQINILSLIENMRKIQFLQKSIKEKADNSSDLTPLNTELLQQLKIYVVIVCFDYIQSLRELFIRMFEIKLELQSEAIYERKKSMLLLEQKRIVKKVFMRYLLLRTKYKSAISKIYDEINSIRSVIQMKKCFKQLYFYSQRHQQKNEFYELVYDHMRVRQLNQIFQNWKQVILIGKKLKNQTKILKNLIVSRHLKLWNQNVKIIINQENEEKQKLQQQIQQEQSDEEDGNKIISQFLTEEKPKDMHGGPSCLQDLQTLFEKEQQAKKVKVLIFELKEDFKQNANMLAKTFIKWKIAFLERYREKQFVEVMEQKRLNKIFKHWKNKKEIHTFYCFTLLRKSIQGFRFNQLFNKQQRLQEQLKKITLKQQRKQINDMSIEVYNRNLIKKTLKGWKTVLNDENLQTLWLSLSDQKTQQDQQITKLKFDVIQKKRKIKYFKKWVTIFVKSKRSIENLKECEISAKDKAIENLIRIAFETSMRTQFKWLQYYKND